MLGICRGMQVMAVAAGGTLEQHLPDLVGHDDALARRRRRSAAPDARPWPGTRLAGSWSASERRRADATTTRRSPTHPGYDAAAWAADGTLEAMEDPDAGFRLGGPVAPRGRRRPAPLRGARRGGREPASATVVTPAQAP